MFWFRETIGEVEVAVTDRQGGVSVGGRSSLDLGGAGRAAAPDVVTNHARLADALGVEELRAMSQVHGADVVMVDGAGLPECDALVTDVRGVALLVRVADCTPVVLADAAAGLVAVAHAGRAGLVDGVVPATVEAMRSRGATTVRAWVGPRACGRCYELPEEMADAVDAAVPGTRSTTSWGTPAVDVGAGVLAQLEAHDVEARDLGADSCTIEDERFFSYRRQGAESGRFGALVVLR
ncbi:peptidoglycan editing factor PgeF [Aeromicrobium halocynthiae]|uniref:Peptidoglycan editing factor PgeF n=1 Tax=Aeromicrobium halocynthiae TaxID=560557 RepID=A0ABN2VSL7_9ACTN